MSAFRTLCLTAVVLLAACARPQRTAPAAAPPLLSSVQATAFGSDSVRFTLQVTNTATVPTALNFTGGQSFDFVVSRDAQEVWRWSAGRMFAQGVRSEPLAPGETRTYTAVWAPATRVPGPYVVRGILTAQNARTEQVTPFTL
jgi:hypothetical protein